MNFCSSTADVLIPRMSPRAGHKAISFQGAKTGNRLPLDVKIAPSLSILVVVWRAIYPSPPNSVFFCNLYLYILILAYLLINLCLIYSCCKVQRVLLYSSYYQCSGTNLNKTKIKTRLSSYHRDLGFQLQIGSRS